MRTVSTCGFSYLPSLKYLEGYTKVPHLRCRLRVRYTVVVRGVETDMGTMETVVVVIAARQRGPVAIAIHVEDQQAISARPTGPRERIRGFDVAIPHALILPARRVFLEVAVSFEYRPVPDMRLEAHIARVLHETGVT